jgi:hypothetical protein
VSVFEGPITRLEGPAAGDPWDEANWALMYIMGCPVRVHPDLVLGGPTSEGEPVRGANLLALLDGVGGRGHALSVFGSTGKGVAERRDVVDPDTSLPQTMYVFREVIVELAENVIIYPDASDAAIDLEDGVEILRLFPDGNGGHQLAARLSSDANFPGGWLDAGGDPLDSLAAALEAAPDKSLGLGGYFSPADTSDGAGETAGTFYVVEGETTAPPATLPAVLVTRYNLRYDSGDGEARLEIRGQYVSDVDLDVASPVQISLEMKHAEGGEGGDGAFPCADTDDGSDCLVASASGADRTGFPGTILDDDGDAVVDETVDCEADPDFPRQCSFRIRVREDVAVDGLEDWLSYHAPLALQYLEKVFTIRVKADDDGRETEAEATPGRIRFD